MLSRLGSCLALALAACASVGPPPPPPGTARAHRIEDVPFVAQARNHCGPASLAMALQHAGAAVSAEELADRTVTTRKRGAFAFDLVGATRRAGHVPYPVRGWEDLFDELAAGRPVVVMQNLGLSWLPYWHFAVAIGFDRERSTLTLHTGRSPARTVSLRVFGRTWSRASYWATVVLPPDRLPAALPERPTLEAIAALEQAGQWDAAARAYQAASARWSDSVPALVGLGNALYQTGDLAGAEEALGRALHRSPASLPVLNNLAHVIGERGRREEARALLEPHVERAGPWREVLERTLETLERQPPP